MGCKEVKGVCGGPSLALGTPHCSTPGFALTGTWGFLRLPVCHWGVGKQAAACSVINWG